MHQLTSLHCYDCQQNDKIYYKWYRLIHVRTKGYQEPISTQGPKPIWQFMGSRGYLAQKNSFCIRNLNEKNIPHYWCWDVCSHGSHSGVELCPGQTYHADQLPAIELLQFASQTPLHHLLETLAIPSITDWSANVELQRSLHIGRYVSHTPCKSSNLNKC